MSRRLVFAGCVCAIVLAGGIAYEYVKRPPLSLERAGSSAVVHVETLADYPTTVRRIQVSEIASRKVIFEVEWEETVEFSFPLDSCQPNDQMPGHSKLPRGRFVSVRATTCRLGLAPSAPASSTR